MTRTPPAGLSAVEEALIGALGDVAVTHRPALYAVNAGAPIARPGIVGPGKPGL